MAIGQYDPEKDKFKVSAKPFAGFQPGGSFDPGNSLEATGGINALNPDLGEGAGGGVAYPYLIPPPTTPPTTAIDIPPSIITPSRKGSVGLEIPAEQGGAKGIELPPPVKTEVPIPSSFNPYSGNFYKNIASMIPSMAKLAVEAGKRKAAIMDMFTKQKLQQGADLSAKSKAEVEALPFKKELLQAQIAAAKRKTVDPYMMEAMKAGAKDLSAMFQQHVAEAKKKGQKPLTWRQFAIREGFDAGGAQLLQEPEVKTEE